LHKPTQWQKINETKNPRVPEVPKKQRNLERHLIIIVIIDEYRVEWEADYIEWVIKSKIRRTLLKPEI